jgi:hypothetical protein
MTRYVLMVALLSMALIGCSSSDSKPGMKVSCTRGTSVQPLTSLEIRQVPAVGAAPPTAMLSYPDPLHTDQTGTLTLGVGERCTVAPATKT